MADKKQSYDPKKGGKFEPGTKAQPPPGPKVGRSRQEEVATRPKPGFNQALDTRLGNL